MSPIFSYTISNKIFEKEPQYVRAVIIFDNILNQETPLELFEKFKTVISEIKSTTQIETIIELPIIPSWREAFKKMGISGSSARPSVESLLRRVVNNPERFKSINLLVDIGNLMSLIHRLPVGIHPFDNAPHSFELRPAHGNEVYLDFSTKKEEVIKPGEVIFADGATVLTRKWVWRQGAQSIIDLYTNKIFINIDFINEMPEKGLDLIIDDIKGSFEKYLNIDGQVFKLSKLNPSIEYHERIVE